MLKKDVQECQYAFRMNSIVYSPLKIKLKKKIHCTTGESAEGVRVRKPLFEYLNGCSAGGGK